MGGGWLIFGLPPSEAAFHPAAESGSHELYLLVDDIQAFAAWMGEAKVPCTEVQEMPWGRLVAITLPGGGVLAGVVLVNGAA